MAGSMARKLRLTGREFRLELDLPPREVSVRVETADAAGRRGGRGGGGGVAAALGAPGAGRGRAAPGAAAGRRGGGGVRTVSGLPRAARPHVRLLRADPALQ